MEIVSRHSVISCEFRIIFILGIVYSRSDYEYSKSVNFQIDFSGVPQVFPISGFHGFSRKSAFSMVFPTFTIFHGSTLQNCRLFTAFIDFFLFLTHFCLNFSMNFSNFTK